MTKDWDNVYQVVKNYSNKRLSKRAALYSLNVSRSQFFKYVRLYKNSGKKAFKQKNLGRKPWNSTSELIEKRIIKLWDETYKSWSIHHFNVELGECYDIHISDMTLKGFYIEILELVDLQQKKQKEKLNAWWRKVLIKRMWLLK